MCARQVQLFGPVRVLDDTEDVPRFRSQRAMALLGYLVAEQRAVARDSLATLFYPDIDRSGGRSNLRRDMHNLGQILPDSWDTDRVSVCFVPSNNLSIDIQRVQQLEEAGDWLAAAKVLRGDYLEGLFFDNSPEFETWLHNMREHWRQRAEQILTQAIMQLEQQLDYHQAIGYAQRLVQQMPWQEEAHRQLMRLLALNGQRSEALRHFDLCKKALARELDVDVSVDTLALYEQIKHRPHFSPNQIPTLVTPLIGRETELSTVAGMVTDPAIRLTTIIGMGGTGKTHLALGVAWQLAVGYFRDGVIFVPVAAEESGDQVVTAIAQALHLPLSIQGPRSVRQQLVDHLEAKEALLILDNCEHLLNDLDIVAALLDTAQRLSILATSRERLRLHSEHLFALQGLARIEERTDHPAAQLFTVAAQRVDPGFAIHELNASAVNRICRMVDGMPLALQLAAAWTDTLSPETIANEIERSLDILAVDLRDLPYRHRSMRALLENTWDHLPTILQRVLARLSIIRRPFDLQAAQAIALTTARNLAQLVSYALLTFDPESDQYEMHELVRQYSLEALQTSDEFSQVQDRHYTYFVSHSTKVLQQHAMLTLRMFRVPDALSSRPDGTIPGAIEERGQQQQLRVLMLTPFPSLAFEESAENGLSRHVDALVRAFGNEKVSENRLIIDLIAPEFTHGTSIERIGPSINIHHVHLPKSDHGRYDAVLVNHALLTDYVDSLMMRQNYALIHLQDSSLSMSGISLLQRWQRPIVITVHATARGAYQNILPDEIARFEKLERQICQIAEQVIVASEAMRQEVRTLFGLPFNKITVIPNGVSMDPDHRISAQTATELRRQYIAPGEKLLLYVGRASYEKGLITLIRAMPDILRDRPNVRLLVASMHGRTLQPLVDELGIEHAVNFLGYVSDEVRDRLYQIADALIIPSLYEPFGLVALEAMALGCTVLASNVGGLCEVVRHEETGLLFAPNDHAQIALAVERLYGDPDAVRRWQTTAIRDIETRFQWSSIAYQTANLYRLVTLA